MSENVSAARDADHLKKAASWEIPRENLAKTAIPAALARAVATAAIAFREPAKDL